MSLATKLAVIFLVILCPTFPRWALFYLRCKNCVGYRDLGAPQRHCLGLQWSACQLLRHTCRYHLATCLLGLITYLYLCFELILLEETGGRLSLDHLALIYNAFDDSWAVVLVGSATSANLVALLLAGRCEHRCVLPSDY